MNKSIWGYIFLIVFVLDFFSIKTNAQGSLDARLVELENKIAALSMQVSGTPFEAQVSDIKEKFFELQIALGRSQKTTLKSCSDSSLNLRTVPIGFKCQTSTGAIYERVEKENFGEAWRGPDGLIWSDNIGFSSQGRAREVCYYSLKGTLPKKADFERGEANGFREVLPNMKRDSLGAWGFYWSSSVDLIYYETYTREKVIFNRKSYPPVILYKYES